MGTLDQEHHRELARTADVRAPPRPTESETLGLGPGILCFNSLPGGSDAGLSLRTTGLKENQLEHKWNPLSEVRVPAGPG